MDATVDWPPERAITQCKLRELLGRPSHLIAPQRGVKTRARWFKKRLAGVISSRARLN